MENEFTAEEKGSKNRIEKAAIETTQAAPSDTPDQKSKKSKNKLERKYDKWLKKEKKALHINSMKKAFANDLQRIIELAVEIKEQKKNIKALRKILKRTESDIKKDTEMKKIRKNLTKLERKAAELENKKK